MGLPVYDYVVIAVITVASFCIGIYYGCNGFRSKSSGKTARNRTIEGYLVGSRKMRVLPIATSMMVSYFSAIQILGNSSEMYYFGAEFVCHVIAYSTAVLVATVTYIPLFYPLRLISVNQYVYLRYQSRPLMYLCTVLNLITLFLVSGIVIFGPAVAIQSMTGIPAWVTMLVSGLLSTVYTTVGGFKAVIWTDVFQTCIILLSLLAVNILGIVNVGGMKEVWQIYADHGRLNLNLSLSPFIRSSVFGFIVPYGITYLPIYCVGQTIVQRTSSLPSLQAAKRSAYLAMPLYCVVASLTCFSGVVAFAYFTKLGCDPLRGGIIYNPNQIVPYFIKSVLNYPCLPGLFIAGILCGALSNLSSAYSACAAMVYNDMLRHTATVQAMTEHRKLLITKVLTLASGLISTVAGFCIAQLKGTFMQLTAGIASTFICLPFIIITLGAISPRSSSKTATVSGLAGLGVMLWLLVGSILLNSQNHLLPTVTTNCLQQNNGIIDQAHILGNDSINSHDMEAGLRYNSTELEMALPDSKHAHTVSNSVGVHWSRLSFVWYFPIAVTISLTLGLLLSFIPGLGNRDAVKEELLFPVLRHFSKSCCQVQHETCNVPNGITVDEQITLKTEEQM